MKHFGAADMYSLMRESESLSRKEITVGEVEDLHASGTEIWATLAEGQDVQILENGKPTEAFFALETELSSFFRTSGASQGANLVVLEGDTSPWSRSLMYGEAAVMLDSFSPDVGFSEILWEGFVESLPAGFAVESAGRGFVLKEQEE